MEKNNTNLSIASLVETLDTLNARYAAALTPFAAILGIFCVIGLLGNIIVIMVFSFSNEYSNTNFKLFVLSLAVVDTLSCVTLMPAEIVKTHHYFSFPDSTPCKVKCFFNVFAMTAATLILLVICIDRYRKVCQPLKPQIRPGLALKILAAVLIFSILVSVPAPIMCGIQEVDKENIYGTNTVVYICSAEEQFQKHIIRYVYKFGMTVLVVGVSLAFIVMYVLIIRTVFRHWNRRMSGETIRFEVKSRSNSAERVENFRLSGTLDDVFEDNEPHANDELKEKRPLSCAQKENATPKTKLTVKDQRPPRKSSSISISSATDRARNVRKVSFMSMNPSAIKTRPSFHRSSTDSSIRSDTLRRRSSSTTSEKLPYKTMIWFILTLIFVLTFIIHSGLSFLTTKEHVFKPQTLFWFLLFFRLYFVNNIINPMIYALLDKRFKGSCKSLWLRCKLKMSKC
ncbi:uncharacterized protein LOC127865201 [Dreissena polymorpha]|uniref:G-protein coupled receptors family 1 profile domain-containing protein n=1 Tax=Dreissena polymorpha TaxID=45954 RepID=A0A9D4N3T6_DREPO|nr:uncharacterized protein LOC127865201 [Dreissena polymorpha]KAH3886774.1 hypothetical protein DPMN_010787 [Dreissena polymorpha]